MSSEPRDPEERISFVKGLNLSILQEICKLDWIRSIYIYKDLCVVFLLSFPSQSKAEIPQSPVERIGSGIVASHSSDTLTHEPIGLFDVVLLLKVLFKVDLVRTVVAVHLLEYVNDC